MNPQPKVIGHREDGTVLGELNDQLYVGTPRQASQDEVEREDNDGRSLYHINGHVIASGPTPEYDHEPEKVWKDVLVQNEDSTTSVVSQEILLTVIVWETL